MRVVAPARDPLGKFAAQDNTAPDVTFGVAPDAEGFRATIEDFLEHSLPGFGFTVGSADIEAAVDVLVTALIAADHRA